MLSRIRLPILRLTHFSRFNAGYTQKEITQELNMLKQDEDFNFDSNARKVN